jgi:phage terminase large subunit
MEPFKDTAATQKIFSLTKRIRAVCGGTSASKTISILVWLIDYAQTNKNKKIDVFAESYPHLKDGAIRDFQNIMLSNGYWQDTSWNSTDKVYSFSTGSQIKFIAVDKIGKAKGPRRDVAFINEANHAMTWEVFDQIEPRTREVVWLDWNPSDEFWYYEKIKEHRDHDFITLTYQDCLNVLPKSIIDSIESHRGDYNWWKVYGLGELGVVEGRIYKDWSTVSEVPHEARLERYGLDFGWYPDPVAVVGVYYYNGGYILDEKVYQVEMSNRELAGTLKNMPKALIVADSAEPKSISELRTFGLNVTPTVKGADSVRHGIKAVQDQKISITAGSTHLIKEYRNYLWQSDKDGKLMPGVPVDGNDHCLDAVRYAINSLVPIIRRKENLAAAVSLPRSRANVGL